MTKVHVVDLHYSLFLSRDKLWKLLNDPTDFYSSMLIDGDRPRLANINKKLKHPAQFPKSLEFTKKSYSSADSWKPPVHVSDWLIFCCRNLRLYQKKEIKMIKNNKKYQKGICKHMVAFFHLNSPH